MKKFIVGEEKIVLSKHDVEKVAKRLPFFEVKNYGVKVNGRIFPPKELLHEVLKSKGISIRINSFTVKEAIQIFNSLGFKVTKRFPFSLSKFSGIVAVGGDSVREKREIYGKNSS